MGIRAVTTEELYDLIGRVCEARAAIERAFVAVDEARNRTTTPKLVPAYDALHRSQLEATDALAQLIKLSRGMLP
jgi:hypothetical protein